MRTLTSAIPGTLLIAGLFAISGCTTYVPVQSTIARLSPEQLAAINSNDKLSAEQKQRLTDQNQQILNDQASLAASTVVVPRTVVVDPWYGGYYPGYYNPYPGFAPFYPGISLSLGYVWGRGGYRGGYGGGWHGHR